MEECPQDRNQVRCGVGVGGAARAWTWRNGVTTKGHFRVMEIVYISRVSVIT